MSRHLLSRLYYGLNPKQLNYSTKVTVEAAPLAVVTQKVSRAMKSYLERAEANDEFMKSQTLEYHIGKRHLANMVGADSDNFSQEDANNAIEYLFPSGIYDKKAKPLMRHPEEIFPARKTAEFDETGRPFHSMFYTGRPNFFKLLYDIVEQINKVQKIHEINIRKGIKLDPNLSLDLTGYEIMSKEQLEGLLVEQIAQLEYNNFVNSVKRLSSLPYSYKSNDFIKQYMRSLVDQSKSAEILKPEIDENGRQFVVTKECLRKTARGDVLIRMPGTGKISINGSEITHFDSTQSREQIMFPLVFTDMVGKVDIEAHVEGGGPSGQAGAIRWGIAMSLRSLVEPEIVENMRLAGLLTRDYRRRERKKPGQEGARRKYTWKKR